MAFSIAWLEDAVQDEADEERARRMLAWFRGELYRCFAKRPDALSELATRCCASRTGCTCWRSCRWSRSAAAATARCMTRSIAGEVQVARLRRALAALALPAWDDGRIRLAADVSNWLRPDAETSPDRLFCHCYARGKGNAQMIPGWPYSFVAALEPGAPRGRCRWTPCGWARPMTPPR